MYFLIPALALAATAAAAPAADPAANSQPAPELATFEDISSGFPPGPYHKLNWTEATVVRSNGALAPASGDYYTESKAYADALTALQNWRVVAPVTTFDMQEIYVGTAAERPGRNGAPSSWTPIKSQFVFQCTTPTRHAGPVLLSYDPATAGKDASGRVKLQKYDVSTISGCTDAWLSLYTSDAGVANTKVFLDNVKYVTN